MTEKQECKHEHVDPYWDYLKCKECGAIHTDDGWGIASLKWFKSFDDAQYYKMHGRLPE